MKIGDFVKIDHKYMSPPTAKRYNNNPMGLVTWVWGTSQIWAKVILTDGREYSYPASVLEVLNESR
jgi:hypothetical protein